MVEFYEIYQKKIDSKYVYWTDTDDSVLYILDRFYLLKNLLCLWDLGNWWNN